MSRTPFLDLISVFNKQYECVCLKWLGWFVITKSTLKIRVLIVENPQNIEPYVLSGSLVNGRRCSPRFGRRHHLSSKSNPSKIIIGQWAFSLSSLITLILNRYRTFFWMLQAELWNWIEFHRARLKKGSGSDLMYTYILYGFHSKYLIIKMGIKSPYFWCLT